MIMIERQITISKLNSEFVNKIDGKMSNIEHVFNYINMFAQRSRLNFVIYWKWEYSDLELGEIEKCGYFQAISGEKNGFRDSLLCVCRLRGARLLSCFRPTAAASILEWEIIFPFVSLVSLFSLGSLLTLGSLFSLDLCSLFSLGWSDGVRGEC